MQFGRTIGIAMLSCLAAMPYISESSTQTMSYLEYHKTHPKLGKFYTYLHAAHNENQYSNTHTPVYFACTFEDFAQYLCVYCQEAQRGCSAPQLSALSHLVRKRDISGYILCSQALSSSKFRYNGVRHILDEDEVVISGNTYESCAYDIQCALNWAMSHDFQKWEKGVIIQVFVPHAYADYIQFRDHIDVSARNMHAMLCNNLVETVRAYNWIPEVTCDLERICKDNPNGVHVTAFAPGVSYDIEDIVYARLKPIIDRHNISIQIDQKEIESHPIFYDADYDYWPEILAISVDCVVGVGLSYLAYLAYTYVTHNIQYA